MLVSLLLTLSLSTNWEPIDDADEVQVFLKEVDGSDVHAFRSIAVIKAPIKTVASLLVNINRAHHWNPDLENAKTIEVISDFERIDYWHYGTPFVIKDRDFVLHSKARVDPRDKSIVFEFQSVDHPKAPKTDNVRGRLHRSQFKLSPIEGGKWTKVLYEVHADPMGSVPKWIINSFSRDFPRQMMVGIRKELRRKPVAIDIRIHNHYPPRTSHAPAGRTTAP